MMESSLIELILPKGLLDHFEIRKVEQENGIHIHLDEKAVKPSGTDTKLLESKGFTQAVTLQDFPIRESACYLHIRRRKWVNKTTGEIISNSWDLSATGTRMTAELAAFLKEAPGYYIG